jgi:hypothetical protein
VPFGKGVISAGFYHVVCKLRRDMYACVARLEDLDDNGIVGELAVERRQFSVFTLGASDRAN